MSSNGPDPDTLSWAISTTLKTLHATKSTQIQKENFNKLSSYLEKITHILQELTNFEINDSGSLKNAIHVLTKHVSEANNLALECTNRNKIYLLLNSKKLVKTLENITKEMANALNLLPNFISFNGLSQDIIKLSNIMMEPKYQETVREDEIKERIESGIRERNVDRAYANSLLVSIADVIGISTEQSVLRHTHKPAAQTVMGSVSKEILHDVPPYIRVYKDGTIERLVGLDVVPASFDIDTGVTSKDVVISPETGVSARLYRPTLTTASEKLPLVIYFHGGAFCIASPFYPKYHQSLTNLVSEARVIAVSVDYRLAPEHPLPAAFDDSHAALWWVSSHAPGGTGTEEWIKENVDFDRIFLAGDSAGATIAHDIAMRIGSNPDPTIPKLSGIILINPYFWGKEPIGSEKADPVRKAMVDKWWEFVCPSDSHLGLDDPLINPLRDGAPDMSGLGCGRVIVTVSEKDILRDRGWAYYETLVKGKWEGKVEMMEIEGEDHVFHIFDPNGEKAVNMMKRLGSFINQQ